MRIKYAIELIRNNNEKAIFEIMYESGFNTKGSFNSAFKKHTGITPSEYKQHINKLKLPS